MRLFLLGTAIILLVATSVRTTPVATLYTTLDSSELLAIWLRPEFPSEVAKPLLEEYPVVSKSAFSLELNPRQTSGQIWQVDLPSLSNEQCELLAQAVCNCTCVPYVEPKPATLDLENQAYLNECEKKLLESMQLASAKVPTNHIAAASLIGLRYAKFQDANSKCSKHQNLAFEHMREAQLKSQPAILLAVHQQNAVRYWPTLICLVALLLLGSSQRPRRMEGLD